MKKYKAYRNNGIILLCLLIFIISISLRACSPVPDKKNDAAVKENATTAGDGDHYNSIFTKIKIIVSNSLSVDSALVRPQSRLSEDLGADELDTVEFIMELEKKFGITIADEAAERIRTINDAVLYVKDHTVKK